MKIKRLLAVLISTALVVSMIPSFVFADEAEGETEETKVTETTVEETKPSEKETESSEPEREEETEPTESEPDAPAEGDEAKETTPAESEETKGPQPSEESADPEETEPETTEPESTEPETTEPDATEEVDPDDDSQEAMNKVIDSGECGDNAKWSIDGNGKLSITGTGDVYDYVSNGPWYPKRAYIKSIEIADGITGYGSECFKGLTNVTSVSIAGSVMFLEKHSFSDCQKLSSVTLGEGTVLVSTAFQGCTALKSINIPSTVKSISQNAFAGCKSLTAISLPSGIFAIGVNAFSGCTSLKTVKLPDNITKIYAGCFSDCTALTGISIPRGVTLIEEKAFYGCTSLSSVTLPNTLEHIEADAFRNCTSLTGVSLPDSCINYGDNIFMGCTSLTSISIPSGTDSISISEFSMCTSLQTISIPKSVKTILNNGFVGCSNLKDIYYNGTASDWSAVRIDNSNNEWLKNVNVNFSGTFHTITVMSAEHGSVTLSKYSAVEGETITITSHPDSGYFMSQLKVNNSYYSYYTTQFTMPDDDVTVIPGFNEIIALSVGNVYYNNILTFRVINNALDGTGSVSFYSIRMIPEEDENLRFSTYGNINIPSTVYLYGAYYKVIGIEANALKDFKYVKTVTIGANVSSIGDNAFYGCPNLTKVSGLGGLKTIGKNAFARCPRLSSLIINSKVLAKIGQTAFYKDSKLKTLYIKNTTKLSKKGVKKSLKGSSVKTVKVKKSKVKKYKKYFSKKNCGKKVKVKK